MSLSEAERHVRDGEERVSCQIKSIARLQTAGRHDEARSGRELLLAMTEALNAARHLWRKRRAEQ